MSCDASLTTAKHSLSYIYLPPIFFSQNRLRRIVQDSKIKMKAEIVAIAGKKKALLIERDSPPLSRSRASR
jgi:hypothetical protein